MLFFHNSFFIEAKENSLDMNMIDQNHLTYKEDHYKGFTNTVCFLFLFVLYNNADQRNVSVLKKVQLVKSWTLFDQKMNGTNIPCSLNATSKINFNENIFSVLAVHTTH